MASRLGSRPRATPSQVQSVVHAIRRAPIIDNHAHPLLKPEAFGKHQLLSITSEASGDAIDAVPTGLPHLRAVRQLASLLNCDQTWEAVVAAIEQQRAQSNENWTRRCLNGVETILIDDGLDAVDDAQNVAWHDSYTPNKCKRIVRIEALATSIINTHIAERNASGRTPRDLFETVTSDFVARIEAAIANPEVAAFKSVICYRTGLDIPRTPDMNATRGSLTAIFEDPDHQDQLKRLQHPGLNDFFVHVTASLIKGTRSGLKKPIQFHTGLGDNDITLAKSSPSHLQEFIRVFPDVPIVLLHAGYPFTRETGYLASVYPNVYADIGEVFPAVSQDGQNSIVRQILEVCPWSKILWSTDGHWFPETYLLAVTQIRESLETVLCEYVQSDQLGWKEAIGLARDILFHNSNKLYHLGLKFDELLPGKDSSFTDVEASQDLSDLHLFQRFLTGRETPDFVRICWLDYTATPRMRMVPAKKFTSLLESGSTDIGITKACLGLLQNDVPIPGVSATGEYRLHPDFSSLKAGPIDGHVTMQGNFREQDGSAVPLCPRSFLEHAVKTAAQHGLAFRVGFEIEFVLLERLSSADPPSERYRPLSADGHAWSTARPLTDPKIALLLRTIVRRLADVGIDVEQLHAESANGQFELILPHQPPVQAVDTLLHTREILSALATEAGFRVTLHPKPFPHACGTAAHAHLSICSPRGSERGVYEPFYAGVLGHLRDLVAFAYSSPASYERRADGCWAGGTWVSWGTQNREAALRKIEGSHWEIKTLDGIANPYLALGAVLSAGTHGVLAGEALVWGDCGVDPSSLTDGDRGAINVTERLPASLEEALDALEADTKLTALLGHQLVERYIAVKRAELGLLANLRDQDRRQWIIERY